LKRVTGGWRREGSWNATRLAGCRNLADLNNKFCETMKNSALGCSDWDRMVVPRLEKTMGWNLRRSVNFGPLRVNFSKSGVGYSVGTRGLRVGRDAEGRRYSSISIPRTGIYRRDYLSNAPPQISPAPPPPNPPVLQNSSAPGWRSAAAVRWILCIGNNILDSGTKSS